MSELSSLILRQGCKSPHPGVRGEDAERRPAVSVAESHSLELHLTNPVPSEAAFKSLTAERVGFKRQHHSRLTDEAGCEKHDHPDIGSDVNEAIA